WDLGEPWAKILPSKKPATTSFWQLNLAISEIKENIVETKRTRAIRWKDEKQK
ncbi:17735_t:CDS:2, partial [Rhizophagus irregularis]